MVVTVRIVALLLAAASLLGCQDDRRTPRGTSWGIGQFGDGAGESEGAGPLGVPILSAAFHGDLGSATGFLVSPAIAVNYGDVSVQLSGAGAGWWVMVGIDVPSRLQSLESGVVHDAGVSAWGCAQTDSSDYEESAIAVEVVPEEVQEGIVAFEFVAELPSPEDESRQEVRGSFKVDFDSPPIAAPAPNDDD